jgi:TonB-linked SusC/RagA family outer membrane protein
MKLKVNYMTRWLLFVVAMGLSNLVVAQTISGTITDASTGEPLIGANILVVGTSTGTITDFDGKYSLNMPEGATQLEISYTGYSSQTIDVNGRTLIDLELAVGEVLEEVVVIGYGTQKKSDVTGAISSLSLEDFNQGIITSADQLIQGKVPGVQITNNSGAPGGAATIRVRGIGSLRSGGDPLYVIDGVPLDGRSAAPGLNAPDLGDAPGTNPLTFYNAADIASIDILKDASSAAIYGSRGANGVVLITTKKGRPGEPVIEFAASAGFSAVARTYDVLTASEYVDALNQYGLTGGNEGADVDAFDEITRTGMNQNYSVAVSGGSENSNYRISLNYLEQEGIVKETGLEKFSANLLGGFDLLKNKRLRLDYSLIASHLIYQNAPITTNAGFTGNLIGQALQWNPTSPLYDENSPTGFNVLFGSTTINPVALLGAYDDQSNATVLLGTINPSYKITDDLTYRFTYSINQSTGLRTASIAPWINVQGVEDRGWAGLGSNTLTTQYLSHILNYNKGFGSSTVDVILGYDYFRVNNSGYTLSAQDFDEFGIDPINALQGSSVNSRIVSSFADPIIGLQSYFGRTNLSFNGKYNFTATVRADGSTKFGEDNKYGVFPSFAASWNIHEEDFIPTVFSSLRLRAGWGQTGNQEFPAGASLGRFQVQNGGGSVLTETPNPALRWETSTTFNVGVDFAVFDYRVVGSVEYFNRTTSDMLFNSAIAAPAPSASVWKNLDGELINSGVELGIDAYIVDNEKVSWSVGGNLAFITNELKDFGRIEEVGGLFGQGISGSTSQRFIDGQPIYVFYLRQHLGIGEDGQSEYVGGAAETKDYVGDPIPDALVGIFSTLNVGNLFANVAFNGAYGHQLYNNTANTVIPIGNLGSRNIDANLLGGPVQEATSNAIKASDRYMEDGDYLKLTNASIGYNFGDIGWFKGLSVSVTGQNLLVITDYSGFDPEVNTVNQNANGVPSYGIEYVPYPTARTVLLNVGFKL